MESVVIFLANEYDCKKPYTKHHIYIYRSMYDNDALHKIKYTIYKEKKHNKYISSVSKK